MDRTEASEKLYRAACDLFIEKGFNATTVREIADRAEVNSGLMHYYFKSKRNIAIDSLIRMYRAILTIVDDAVDPAENPAVYHGIMMRLHLYFLYSDKNAKFYTDCLKEDIFEEIAIPRCLDLMEVIDKAYGGTHDETYLMLIQSIAISAQRTMILKKQAGLMDYSLEAIGELEYRIFLSFFSVDPKEADRLLETCSGLARTLHAKNLHLEDLRNLI